MSPLLVTKAQAVSLCPLTLIWIELAMRRASFLAGGGASQKNLLGLHRERGSLGVQDLLIFSFFLRCF